MFSVNCHQGANSLSIKELTVYLVKIIYKEFSLVKVVVFYKVTGNIEYLTITSRRNTELVSGKLLSHFCQCINT